MASCFFLAVPILLLKKIVLCSIEHDFAGFVTKKNVNDDPNRAFYSPRQITMES